jgi:hypothetical protein
MGKMNMKELGAKSMGLGVEDITVRESLVTAGILPKELTTEYSRQIMLQTVNSMKKKFHIY